MTRRRTAPKWTTRTFTEKIFEIEIDGDICTVRKVGWVHCRNRKLDLYAWDVYCMKSHAHGEAHSLDVAKKRVIDMHELLRTMVLDNEALFGSSAAERPHFTRVTRDQA